MKRRTKAALSEERRGEGTRWGALAVCGALGLACEGRCGDPKSSPSSSAAPAASSAREPSPSGEPAPAELLLGDELELGTLDESQRRTLELLGLVCAPAAQTSEEGQVEALGCVEGTPGGRSRRAPALRRTWRETFEGSFQGADTVQSVLWLESAEGAELILLEGAGGALRRVASRAGPSLAECRVSSRQRTLLVCLTHRTAQGGGNSELGIFDFTRERPEVLLSVGAALEPWAIVCPGVGGLGPSPSYSLDTWKVEADGGVSVELTRHGWTASELARVSTTPAFRRSCAAALDSLDSEPPRMPETRVHVAFTREGDTFVVTPQTRESLHELGRQWERSAHNLESQQTQ